jgi:hypothetical protein
MEHPQQAHLVRGRVTETFEPTVCTSAAPPSARELRTTSMNVR